MTFPDIFDVKMLIVANIFKDFHHHVLPFALSNGTKLNIIMYCDLCFYLWNNFHKTALAALDMIIYI